MCKFSSKSGGVPFQISFFLGDLTRNDPMEISITHYHYEIILDKYFGLKTTKVD